MPTINMAATGQNINTLRKAAGMTVHDLQLQMGFNTPQAIFKCSGETRCRRSITWSFWQPSSELPWMILSSWIGKPTASALDYRTVIALITHACVRNSDS